MEGSDNQHASGSSSGPGTGTGNNEASTVDQPVDDATDISDQTQTASADNDGTEDMEIEGDMAATTTEAEDGGEAGNMEVHLDSSGEPAEDMGMEAGPSNPGKRVKVSSLSLENLHATLEDRLELTTHLGVRVTRFIMVRQRDGTL